MLRQSASIYPLIRLIFRGHASSGYGYIRASALMAVKIAEKLIEEVVLMLG